jgi:hypothetical protein
MTPWFLFSIISAIKYQSMIDETNWIDPEMPSCCIPLKDGHGLRPACRRSSQIPLRDFAQAAERCCNHHIVGWKAIRTGDLQIMTVAIQNRAAEPLQHFLAVAVVAEQSMMKAALPQVEQFTL